MSVATVMGPEVGSAVDYDPFAGGELATVVPTTEPQREVWLADQLGRDASLAFNESSSLGLHGPLDRAALARALDALLARHDALRASFGPDGQTMCVRAPSPLELPFTDLSAMGAQERDDAVSARLRAAVESPFHLDRDPLLRVELLRLQADRHLLVMTAHHIVCDGWSWWVLVRDLGALYARELDGHAPPLPPAETFAGYARAMAGSGGAAAAADEAFWLSRFQDGAPVLDLPLDRPRPARRSFASRREDHVLDAALVEAVKRMGARRGASLFATLLAGFAQLVSRLSGQQEVVVGIPAAGQSVDGHDNLVGHCVNLLPLRFDLEPSRSFGEALGSAQQTLLDAIEHQRYTFGTLLQKLRLARDPARLPLVSVMFNIDQALERETTGFPGLRTTFASNPRSFENFELFINAVQAGGRMTLECQYNADLFDAATVRRWLAAFDALLRSAVEAPDASAARLPLVAGRGYAELRALQPPPVPYDSGCRMHEAFERQCDRAPERTALQFGDATLSYAQLEARANRIAHLLRSRGVRRGSLVGLALDRGVDMLAGLLGILKSGAGYVPLDPAFPAERLAYMAGDAGLAALLTQAVHSDRFDLRGRPVLPLDRLDDELALLGDDRIGRDADAADPESIAYVIYTSGSTGRPKGVQVPHRAVANFLVAMQREPGIGADERLVAVTTLSFDIAVLELLLPLSAGARVVLAPRETAVDGVALSKLLATSGATMMQATPATWRLLLDADWRGDAAFSVLCGGEPLPPELAAALLPRCGALWNLYGPTETTVWSTIARVAPPADGNRPDIHIGHPIANTRVWILDAHGGLCPRGVAGEICIGGEGVTLGYRQRPELNADRFIADPFEGPWSAPDGARGALLYRTGDRGRWRADGALEHLGRLDFQVKVRGYRIELGEIENTLGNHPDVGEVVVLAREDRPGDVRLVAYVVPRSGQAVDEAALVGHLRSALPDYMVPQHVVGLERMPRLPNGKLDRNALPAPGPATRHGAAAVAPRNPLERTIATAMAEVLGLEEVGVEDDFFAAGGHSLLAAQLTSRLNRELGITLSLRTLFDAPTVASLALAVARVGDAPAEQSAPIPRRPDQRRAPLSLIQERLWRLEEFNPGRATYNTPSAHLFHGPLDPEVFERAFRAMLQRQSVLRTTIGEQDGGPVQVVHDDLDTGLLPVVDMTGIPAGERDAELQRRLEAIVAEPLDMARAPLFVARLYRLEPERHALMFMPHHIIWDGWSFDLLYSDMAELYAALLEGREPDLPPLPVSYGDFAAWQRDWVKGPEYARQQAFWRGHLGGGGLAPERRPHALRTDLPRRPGMSGRGATHKFAIPGELAQALARAGTAMGTTMFVTLLAAYFTLMHGISGQHNLIVATPVRGRHRPEVETMMGYFANLLPLRMELDPQADFPAVVKQVRAVVLDGLGHPDIRLEDLMQELTVENPGGGRLLYQSLFSYQDIRQRVTQWGPLRHERLEVFHPAATEDLSMWFVEGASEVLGVLIYNAEIFHESTVVRVKDRYLRMLRRIAEDPAQPVRELVRFDDGQPALIGRDPNAPVEAPPEPIAEPLPDQPPADDGTDPRVRYLVDLWSRLLGVTAAPEDNFFDLGGNSMLGVQMAEQVVRDTGVRFRLVRLASQSLEELAADLPAAPGAAPAAQGNRLVAGLRRIFGRVS